MACSLCYDKEVVEVRGDVFNRSYPCPECRIVSYHIQYEVKGHDLAQAAGEAEERIDEIKRTLRDRLLDEMIEKVGEYGHQHEVSDDNHKFTARVVVVRPLKKGA